MTESNETKSALLGGRTEADFDDLALADTAAPGGAMVCQDCGTHPLPASARSCHNCGGRKLTLLLESGAPAPGLKVLDRYILLDHLGRGGFGSVFRAIHTQLERIIAIKVMHVDGDQHPKLLKRFFGEAKNSARLSHPHNIKVFDFGHTGDGVAFLAMELVDGSPLSGVPMPIQPGRVLLIADQVAGALGEAHQYGLVHRDLKPPNIMVSDVDGADFARVLDYGISKLVDSSTDLTQVGGFIGSPDYAAPEQVSGSGGGPDPRTDIYALGVVMYEMLTGSPPFQADDPLHVLYMHRHEPPDPVREHTQVSRQLNQFVARCLEKNPDDRFASMAALRSALRALPEFSHQESTDATPWSGATEETAFVDDATKAFEDDAPVRAKKSPVGPILAAVAVLLALGLGAFLFAGGDAAPENPSETVQEAAAREARPAESDEPSLPEPADSEVSAAALRSAVLDATRLATDRAASARSVARTIDEADDAPEPRRATTRRPTPTPAAQAAPATRPEPSPEPEPTPEPEPSRVPPASPEPEPAPEPEVAPEPEPEVDPRELLLQRTRNRVE